MRGARLQIEASDQPEIHEREDEKREQRGEDNGLSGV
jgi:hypothetical protein